MAFCKCLLLPKADINGPVSRGGDAPKGDTTATYSALSSRHMWATSRHHTSQTRSIGGSD